MAASLQDGVKPAPMVLSSNIDDTWALAHSLRTPELDLKRVFTETGEAAYRSMVAAKMLEMALKGGGAETTGAVYLETVRLEWSCYESVETGKHILLSGLSMTTDWSNA